MLTAKIAIRGFMIMTSAHILRSVFGKTPGRCSSTKLAEVSKPVTPNMAVLKPRKRATVRLPFKGLLKLNLATSSPLALT